LSQQSLKKQISIAKNYSIYAKNNNSLNKNIKVYNKLDKNKKVYNKLDKNIQKTYNNFIEKIFNLSAIREPLLRKCMLRMLLV